MAPPCPTAGVRPRRQAQEALALVIGAADGAGGRLLTAPRCGVWVVQLDFSLEERERTLRKQLRRRRGGGL